MEDMPTWLPELILLSDHKNEWQRYIDAVFAVFYRDFIESQPQLDNRWVRCRRDPIYDGKEAGFWHCISGGPDENNRNPELRRCERIGWIRAVIENYKDVLIRTWKTKKKSDLRVYIWFNENYLVVLGERRRYVQLITAFCTDRRHTIRKLKSEYRRSINS